MCCLLVVLFYIENKLNGKIASIEEEHNNILNLVVKDEVKERDVCEKMLENLDRLYEKYRFYNSKWRRLKKDEVRKLLLNNLEKRIKGLKERIEDMIGIRFNELKVETLEVDVGVIEEYYWQNARDIVDRVVVDGIVVVEIPTFGLAKKQGKEEVLSLALKFISERRRKRKLELLSQSSH